MPSRLRRALRATAVDLSPLRASRDYRMLWFGSLVGETGSQISKITVYYQVFHLTNSPAAVGIIGLAGLVPLVLVSIAGAPLADRHDRQKLLLATESAAAAATALLLLVSFVHRPPIAAIYIAWALKSGTRALSSPTRSAMTPNLVGVKMIPQAQTLVQVMWNTAQVAGPAVGGVVIAHFGIRWAYGVDVLSYAVAVPTVAVLRSMPPAPRADRATGLKAIREGFAFLKGHRVIQSTFVVDLVAMIFGMPVALFPVLALKQFHRGPQVLGTMMSAIAFGALIGALTAGWVGRIRAQGRAVLIAVAVWGAGITAFGFSGRNLAIALVCLAVAGGADVISAVFRGTILQVAAPDELRGRLTGLHILVVAGGPRLGDFEAGVVAQAFTPFVSVVSGGLACIAGVAVMAVLVPEFTRYRIPPSIHAAPEDIPAAEAGE